MSTGQGGIVLTRLAARFSYVVLRRTAAAFRDLTPIIAVIAIFQFVVLQQPFPDLERTLVGLAFVVAGLVLFVEGLEQGLFPLGESMAEAFARRGNLTVLLAFSFGLGFATTVAEPALISVAGAAAETAAAGGTITDSIAARESYALNLRLVVAFAVGCAIMLGVFRILKGWPIHFLIIGGYLVVTLLTLVAPDEFIGIAYDVGGVTTSTITVPLVTALGVGLAASIRGRSPILDGFGLIAFASLTPMMFVLVYGALVI